MKPMFSPHHCPPPQKRSPAGVSRCARNLRAGAFTAVAWFCLWHATAGETVVLRPDDRIVFVGDSITGLGWNQAQGFIHQIGTALEHESPAITPTLIALGGSGQGVSSWRNVEARSRDVESTLDAKAFPVKANLDTPAGVVVIMLGMNDLIAPYVSAQPEAIAAWTEHYRKLVQALRQRLAPRVLALATIPPATEDPASPKNRVRDRLNAALHALAEAEKCPVLPVGETILDLLGKGRTLNPGFRVTSDYVHPSAAGHAAIALAMLQGLGLERAATWQEQNVIAPLLSKSGGEAPSFSATIVPQAPTAPGAIPTFIIEYWLCGGDGNGTIPSVSLTVPDGWQVTPPHATTPAGRFAVTGNPELWVNRLTLTAVSGTITRTLPVDVPTPWLVGTGLVFPVWPGNQEYLPDNARPAFEAALTRGEGIGSPLTYGKRQLTWKRFYPSVDFVGGADPANLDGWGCDFGETFAGAYAARWVHSPRERPVTLNVRSATFAGKIGTAVWLNATRVYQGEITAEPRKTASATATLEQGWNLLLVRWDHLAWQWQISVALAAVGDDTLADLRYATTRPPASP